MPAAITPSHVADHNSDEVQQFEWKREREEVLWKENSKLEQYFVQICSYVEIMLVAAREDWKVKESTLVCVINFDHFFNYIILLSPNCDTHKNRPVIKSREFHITIIIYFSLGINISFIHSLLLLLELHVPLFSSHSYHFRFMGNLL